MNATTTDTRKTRPLSDVGTILVIDTGAPELRGLLVDRRRLLRQLAKVLRRVGPSQKQRAAINHTRAIERKALRKALRKNAEQIATYMLTKLHDIP